MVTLAAIAFSFALFWAILSKKLLSVEQRLFDKAKLKYTDEDNTWYDKVFVAGSVFDFTCHNYQEGSLRNFDMRSQALRQKDVAFRSYHIDVEYEFLSVAIGLR